VSFPSARNPVQVRHQIRSDSTNVHVDLSISILYIKRGEEKRSILIIRLEELELQDPN
jgi:hypothetical protein